MDDEYTHEAYMALVDAIGPINVGWGDIVFGGFETIPITHSDKPPSNVIDFAAYKAGRSYK
jgi:hypothetical protein